MLLYDIMYQIAQGVENLHRIGIVHKDLKMENIVINAAVFKKAYANALQNQSPIEVYLDLIDFGMACSMTPGVDQCSLTKRNGTPGYIAPEIIQAHVKPMNMSLLPKLDIFALGATFYALVKGFALFDGQDTRETLVNTVTNKSSLRYWPIREQGLNVLVTDMIQTDPAQRPSASEVRQRLETLMAGYYDQPVSSRGFEIFLPPRQP
jgi:protein kinase